MCFCFSLAKDAVNTYYKDNVMTPLNLPAHLTPFLMTFLVLFTLTLQGCFHNSSGGGEGGVTPTSPVFTSGDTISVAENILDTGYTAVATDADGDTVTFSLTGGEDQSAFGIDSDSGVLSFNTATDFESPTDSDTNNTYVVEITATDGTNFVVQSLTVTVIDINVSNGVDPTGYYTNTGFVDVKAGDDMTQRLVTDIQGMVTGEQLMLLSDTENLTYIGTFAMDENNFSGSVTLYEAGVMIQENVPVNGLITEGARITGTLSGTGAANGTFQLDYAADNGAVTLDQVVRVFGWEPVINENIPVLNLANATLPEPAFNFRTSGTSSNIFGGCRYGGRMEPITGTHLYTVSVTMEDCDPGTADVQATPVYTGLASVRGTDRFILALSNGAYDFSGEYFECLVLFCTPQ